MVRAAISPEIFVRAEKAGSRAARRPFNYSTRTLGRPLDDKVELASGVPVVGALSLVNPGGVSVSVAMRIRRSPSDVR